MPRLNMLLGELPAPPGQPSPAATLTGAGDHARLDPAYTRTTPSAAHHRLRHHRQLQPDRRWRSHSEARQSVLAHAALHGHSLATIRAFTAPGRPWHPDWPPPTPDIATTPTKPSNATSPKP